MSAKNSTPKAAPSNSYQVEVRLRPEFADAGGEAARALLNSLGLATARQVRTSQVFQIRGPYNSGQIQQAARELLSDGVTQEYRVLSPAPPSTNGMNHWRVEVWLKESVSDPAGETVRSALIELGLPAPESVRVAQAFHITGHCHKSQLEKIIPRGLANPVIHRFTVSETSL